MKLFLLLVIVCMLIAVGGWYFYTHTGASPDTIPEENATATGDTTMDGMSHSDTEEPTETVGSDAGMEFPMIETEGNTKVFTITGASFAFDTTEIRVKEGDTVVIHFQSGGGFHDWVIDEFDVRTERVNTGESTQVTFVADRKGTFEYYCSVGDHRAHGMVGTLIVE